jgi:hypothetical protein
VSGSTVVLTVVDAVVAEVLDMLTLPLLPSEASPEPPVAVTLSVPEPSKPKLLSGAGATQPTHRVAATQKVFVVEL